ncbi:putative transposase [Yersinia pestis PY-13]|uniref:Transposase n=2 Tax=Yersinia pestis TaxID=632 RepID=Q8CZU5_YERPE|nr:putative transposase [Yersinia pestis KIM10+]ABG12263.1 putative transposase [Yersinia pestis Antiqua]EIR50222.1 putative transposase [Yersinia pestis PY-13]EIR93444.1 putative transposase [Yersinia pestis PY-36]EIT18463.1 putative transposase [Yersinia pestis PY-93]
MVICGQQKAATLALVCLGASPQTYYCSYFWSSEQKTFRQLLGLLSGFNIVFWCTDNFSAYEMLPDEKHIRSKLYTQRIEREPYLV